MRILTLIIMMILSGCCISSFPELKERSFSIAVGDTKETVLKKIGQKPDDRQFQGEYEAWQFCDEKYWTIPSYEYHLIWFYKGKVTGINTNRHIVSHIKWSDAPDFVLEVRDR